MMAAEDMTLKVQGLTSEEARRRLQELGPNEMTPGAAGP